MTERAKRAVAKLIELGWDCSNYDILNCANCSYGVWTEWKHCPMCGHSLFLSSTAEQDMEAAIAAALEEVNDRNQDD